MNNRDIVVNIEVAIPSPVVDEIPVVAAVLGSEVRQWPSIVVDPVI